MSAPTVDSGERSERTGEAAADRVAAWATGVGVGAMAFMLTWLISNRLTEALWGPTAGAWVALIMAVIAGFAVTALAGARLARRVLS